MSAPMLYEKVSGWCVPWPFGCHIILGILVAVSLLGHPGVLPQRERHGDAGGLSLASG